MVRQAFLLMWLTSAACTGAELAALLKDLPAPLALLAKRPIHVHVAGQVDAPFGRAAAMFLDDGVLADVQAAYARQLPPGETPEFVVHQLAPGLYSYVNKDRQRSEVRELYKALGADDALNAAYLAQGKRFFGRFEALIHLYARPTDDGAVAYDLNVYARPDSALCRMIGRLPPVQRFFAAKTREVADLSARPCAHLTRQSETETGTAPESPAAPGRQPAEP
jgi:hypothetical protein